MYSDFFLYKNCKAIDHSSLQCSIPVKLNLCSSTKHKFKDCPQAYTNQVKLSTTPLFHEQVEERMEEAHTTDLVPKQNNDQIVETIELMNRKLSLGHHETMVAARETSEPPLDSLLVPAVQQTTSQKCQQETSTDNSPTSSEEQEVWPSLPSVSAPFLEPESLDTFSTVTYIKGTENDSQYKLKKESL